MQAPTGRRLLADRDVRRAPIVVARERVVAARAEPDDHLLHLADGEHVVEQVERLAAPSMAPAASSEARSPA